MANRLKNGDTIEQSRVVPHAHDSNVNGGTSLGPVTTFLALNDLDIGAHQFRALQFYADVSTGTAPFVVNSSTVVSSLNADHLDGYDAGNSSGQIPVSNGIKNVNLNADTLDGYTEGNSSGQIPISNGGNCTNLSADYLDGYHASHFSPSGHTHSIDHTQTSVALYAHNQVADYTYTIGGYSSHAYAVCEISSYNWGGGADLSADNGFRLGSTTDWTWDPYGRLFPNPPDYFSGLWHYRFGIGAGNEDLFVGFTYGIMECITNS